MTHDLCNSATKHKAVSLASRQQVPPAGKIFARGEAEQGYWRNATLGVTQQRRFTRAYSVACVVQRLSEGSSSYHSPTFYLAFLPVVHGCFRTGVDGSLGSLSAQAGFATHRRWSALEAGRRSPRALSPAFSTVTRPPSLQLAAHVRADADVTVVG